MARVSSAPVSHVFEPAPSGRSKCRGCGQAIAKGELRFGERMPNLFAEGEMTLWFHPLCAAYKRPEPMLAALAAGSPPAGHEAWQVAAQRSAGHRRLPRIDGAERASSGRAGCRSCQQPIERGGWRIRLAYFEDGRFQPGGFVHLACGREYFECDDLLAALLHFSPTLSDGERAELSSAAGAGSA